MIPVNAQSLTFQDLNWVMFNLDQSYRLSLWKEKLVFD